MNMGDFPYSPNCNSLSLFLYFQTAITCSDAFESMQIVMLAADIIHKILVLLISSYVKFFPKPFGARINVVK
jgi:hypothetical protein